MKITIRVVETMATGSKIKGWDTLEDVVQYVVKAVLAVSGGATVSAPTMGYWQDEQGQLVSELGQDVVTFTNSAWVRDHLEQFAGVLRSMGKQDCVLFTVEDAVHKFV